MVNSSSESSTKSTGIGLFLVWNNKKKVLSRLTVSPLQIHQWYNFENCALALLITVLKLLSCNVNEVSSANNLTASPYRYR